MNYLLEYIECRRSNDAPTFKKTILRSYCFKLLLLTVFLPFDFIFLLLMRRNKGFRNFDFVVFSEKYKEIAAGLGGKVAIITVPSVSLLFWWKRSGIYYIPASLYFWGTFFSLTLGRIFAPDILKFSCKNLVLHTDGLPVPRYILKAIRYENSICLQHGEFRYLNKIYDGILCDKNIVFGEDQARLFIDAGYKGEIYFQSDKLYPELSVFDEGNVVFDKVILVGQGYHVNDPKLHNEYQARLFKIFTELRSCGFKVYYRPHPSENFLNYRKFIFYKEKLMRKGSIGINSLYLGSESTLIRKVRDIGGFSLYIDELEKYSILHLKKRYSEVSLGVVEYSIDVGFLTFALGVLNDQA